MVRLIADEPHRLLNATEKPSFIQRLRGPPAVAKAELGNDLRTAAPLPPGSTFEVRIFVAGGAELRASVGVPAGFARPAVFSGIVRGTDGQEAELFEHRIDPAAESTDRWWEVRAGLQPWLGREVTLVIKAVVEPGSGEALGVPLLADPEVVATHGGRDERFNVVLISIDTLRADHLSLYGYPLPTTPRIDGWAGANAVIFTAAVAPAPWTLPSHVSLLTGLDAVRHGVNHDVGGLGAPGGDAVLALDFLAEILARAGYETAAFTGGAYLDPRFGFAQGFDRYVTWPDRARDRGELEAGVDRALAWMAVEQARPFALFLHTYAVHDPYRVRPGFFDRVSADPGDPPAGRVALKSPKNSVENGFQQVNRFVWRPQDGGESPLEPTDGSRRMVTAMYDSGVAYMDHEIGRLFDGMDELGITSRTVIVFTSDHGESLGEAGRVGHIFLTDENLLVPLIIAAPGAAGGGRRVDRQVRLIDVTPTILDVLGIEPSRSMDGVSLAPLLRGEPAAVPAEAWSYSAAPNRGVSLRIDNRLKFTLNNAAWPPAKGRRELFDLERDHAETANLAEADVRADDLESKVTSYLYGRAAGLRLRIQTGDARLQGRIVGAAVRPVGTKVIGMDGPFLRWDGMGEASVDVPAGRSFTVVFEKVFGGALTVAGEIEQFGSVVSLRERFDVLALEGAEAVVLDGERWRRVRRGLAEGEIGLAVRWQGGMILGGPPAAVDDAELAEQLRALGYIK
jgi:arylsulfatase